MSVQYGDWLGIVVLDGPDDQADLYRLVGIDPGDWIICRLEISGASETAGGVEGAVLAVRRALIDEFGDWAEVARSYGAIPVTRFILRDGVTMAVLGSFKRFDIRATLRPLDDLRLPVEVLGTIEPTEGA